MKFGIARTPRKTAITAAAGSLVASGSLYTAGTVQTTAITGAAGSLVAGGTAFDTAVDAQTTAITNAASTIAAQGSVVLGLVSMLQSVLAGSE